MPGIGEKQCGKTIDDQDVFEHSTYCWAYLMSEAKVAEIIYMIFIYFFIKSKFCYLIISEYNAADTEKYFFNFNINIDIFCSEYFHLYYKKVESCEDQ